MVWIAGKLRVVMDLRALNATVMKDAYLLPLISELITDFKDARYIIMVNSKVNFY
jgi:hypothetical protein